MGERTHTPGQKLEFGWNAAPFAQQLPQLAPLDAEHFDKDNAAIIRLHLRGALSEAERDRAIKRTHKAIVAALSKASPHV